MHSKLIKLTKIKKIKNLRPNDTRSIVKRNHAFMYSLKFYTMYVPSTIKKVRLYARGYGFNPGLTLKKNSKYSFDKILIKQSYIMLIWLNYISTSNSDFGGKDMLNKADSTTPSFFIYPCRKYKFTIIKSPMAHKTFSQEQFLYKTYRLSVSFSGSIGVGITKNPKLDINSSLYLIMFFFRNVPCISTNMIFIQRYSLRFLCGDPNFFSLFLFRLNELYISC